MTFGDKKAVNEYTDFMQDEDLGMLRKTNVATENEVIVRKRVF